MDVLQRIKRWKEERRLTNSELSALSGIPLGTVNKILSGSTASLKLDRLQALAKALSIPLSFLTEDEDCAPAPAPSPDCDGFVRVAALTPATRVGAVSANRDAILSSLREAAAAGADVAVLPELTLSGYTAADVFLKETFLSACEEALLSLVAASASLPMLYFVGCPLRQGGRVYNTAVAVYGGEILGVVPKSYLKNHADAYEGRWFAPAAEGGFNRSVGEITVGRASYPFGAALLFSHRHCRDLACAALIGYDAERDFSLATAHARAGATLLCVLTAYPETIGRRGALACSMKALSASSASALAVANAGQGESTTDSVFAGGNLLLENGRILKESAPFSWESATLDLDLGFLTAERRARGENTAHEGYRTVPFEHPLSHKDLLRSYSKTPFVPEDKEERRARAHLSLRLAAEGLKRRLEAARAKTLVIGVSGGLDSTLALLVCRRALDLAGRDSHDLIAVTMPCFGTTSRTKSNSELLSEALGASFREVSIRDAVTVHLRDIAHPLDLYDVTYENAQARERTQVIMDIANMTGGLVVGTGDLSELALGWATYNGDHMSMYGVNASLPKTFIRHVVAVVAEESEPALRAVLLDILDTPVSPELLPADGDEIAQKTEDLVGPYLLHDFFLYHLLRRGTPPHKLYRIACATFRNEFSPDTVYHWLDTFLSRFFAQQFKRSCLPDGVKIGSVALSPRGDLKLPSDLDRELWLADLKKAKS